MVNKPRDKFLTLGAISFAAFAADMFLCLSLTFNIYFTESYPVLTANT